MYPTSELDNYKLQVELLQEKLQRSEDNRRQLENKLDRIKQKHLSHEKAFKSKARQRYQEFLDEQKKRNERNRMLVEMLERVDSQSAALAARSEHLKMMKMRYEMYFAKLVQSQTMQCLQSVARPIPATTSAVPTTILLQQPSELRQPPPSGIPVINQDIDKGMEDARAKFNDAAIYVASGGDGIQSPAMPAKQRQWRMAMTPPSSVVTRMPTELLLTNHFECIKYPDENVRSRPPDASNLSKVRFQQQIDVEKPQVHCDNVDAYPALLSNDDAVDDCGLEVTRSHSGDDSSSGSVKTAPARNDDNLDTNKSPGVPFEPRILDERTFDRYPAFSPDFVVEDLQIDTTTAGPTRNSSDDSELERSRDKPSISERNTDDDEDEDEDDGDNENESQKSIDPDNGNGGIVPAMSTPSPSADYRRVRFTKKKKLSIENIENVIYGELVQSVEAARKQIDSGDLVVTSQDDTDSMQEENESRDSPGIANQLTNPSSTSSTVDYEAAQIYSHPVHQSVEEDDEEVKSERCERVIDESSALAPDGQDYQYAAVEGGNIDYQNYDPSQHQTEYDAYSYPEYDGKGDNGYEEADQVLKAPSQWDDLQHQNNIGGEQVEQLAAPATTGTPEETPTPITKDLQKSVKFEESPMVKESSKTGSLFSEDLHKISQELEEPPTVKEPSKTSTPITKDLQKSGKLEEPPMVKESSKTGSLISKDFQKSQKLDELPMVKEPPQAAPPTTKDLQKPSKPVEEVPHVKEESKLPATPISKVSKIRSSPSVVKQVKGKPSSIRAADKTSSAEKKKKRVNFVNKETEESSVKPDTLAAAGGSSESDFDFSLSENK